MLYHQIYPEICSSDKSLTEEEEEEEKSDW